MIIWRRILARSAGVASPKYAAHSSSWRAASKPSSWAVFPSSNVGSLLPLYS
jgi:hypothetical protein